MEHATAEFDAKDRELLETARRDTEAAETAAETDQVKEAGAATADTASTAETATPAAPAPAARATPGAEPEAKAQAPAAAPAVAEADPDAKGSTKAALRASRRSEKLLRDENEALRKRIEASGGNTKADDATPKEPDESQLNDVREYAPEVGTAFDRLKAENELLRSRVAASPEPKAAFVPERMPDDVQANIDDVPDLLLWQSSEEHQDKWDAAKAADALLSRSPRWQDRPLAERFAAAVALVQHEMATTSKASTPRTLADAQRAIAAAPTGQAGAVAVGDLRGGATPATSPGNDPHAMVKAGKSDEDIMASLPVLP